MPLKLPFYNKGFTQSGYMLIDKKILIIGFLPDDTTDIARLDADERRNDFMEQLVEYVHPHLENPTVENYSFHDGITIELAGHVNELNAYASHIRYEFSHDINFVTVWLFLVKIPQDLLFDTMDSQRIDQMLNLTKNYFIDLEEIIDSSSWSSYLYSFNIFGGNQSKPVENDSDTYKASREEATRIVQEAMERDAILRRNFN